MDAPPVAFQPTKEQQSVIDAQKGTVLVLAAVGSGKTSTLCRRIARTVAEGVSPRRILALTFTNRAARHLATGLTRFIPSDNAKEVQAATFHGLCYQILKAESETVGLSSDFSILDEEECQAILTDLHVANPYQALNAISEEAARVPSQSATIEGWMNASFSQKPWAKAYLSALGEREAVDFAGLVMLTRALLTQEQARKRWAGCFDSVLVDEVQDTHMSEYEVIKALASQADSLCLVGDLDQTIYGWRGSRPDQLLDALERDFSPVQRLHLTATFRSTRSIIDMANRLAARMPERATVVAPALSVPEGEPVQHRCYAEASDECHQIARCCAEAIQEGTPADEVAVLLRSHQGIKAISAALEAGNVPHMTMAQLRFFRHKEIADCLSVASLVYDRTDETRMRRVVRDMVQGFDARAARHLAHEARDLGLQLSDLIRGGGENHPDPLEVLKISRVVVLDTETTGVDPNRDEVIEIAAVRVIDGVPSQRPADRFHALLKNTIPVGTSEAVHHISDRDLEERGVPPAAAFSALLSFIGDDPIAGHNVGFDMGMLAAHGARVGRPVATVRAYDTLTMARRLIDSPRHDLSTLVRILQLPIEPTHRAMDDVLATAELARVLKEKAAQGQEKRLLWLQENKPGFARLTAALDRWASMHLRPGDLIRELTQTLMKHKVQEPKVALPRLEELAHRLDAMDDPALSPSQALQHALATAALVREGDAMDRTAGVRVLTMHQSKGLEFSRVFIPQLVQNTLPSYRAVKSGDLAKISEERRLLYVAMTRAKRRLYLSWHETNAKGYRTEPSEFLGELLDGS